jgi:hypothetical protein
MTVQTKTFRKEQVDEVVADDRLNKLGLTRLAGSSPFATAKRHFVLMEDKMLGIWQTFLPTRYRRGFGQWEQFEFMEVPTTSQDDIEFALELGCFNDLQIWTPEVKAPVVVQSGRFNSKLDPMVVGTVEEHHTERSFSGDYDVKTTHHFMITQWGESLIDYDDLVPQILGSLLPEGVTIAQLPATVVDFLYVWMARNYKEGTGTRRITELRQVRQKHCGKRMYRASGGKWETGYGICTVCPHIEQ